MNYEPPLAGCDPLRAWLKTKCEIVRFRDGEVISLGQPAPRDLLSAPRVVAVSHPREAWALTLPYVLTSARRGLVYVCNSIFAARAVETCLRAAGAPA